MALMEWNAHLQVGHSRIDEQHKTLADTINQLDAAVGAGQTRADVEALLDFLKGHAEKHFLADKDVFRSLAQLASSDVLTGAWNRRQFEEAVEAETHRACRYGHPLSLLLVDVDHFKRVNDTFGHTVGDQVLREIATCIRSVVRVSDSLTRWGGEEFIVLLPNTGITSAVVLAERIRQRLASHDFPGIGQVTASVGAAEYVPAASREVWLERADRAMYRAKKAGRNRVEADLDRDETRPATEHLEGAFLRLVWSDSYRSGNTVIDTQHEHLFQLSNVLIDALLSGRPLDEVSGFVTALTAAVLQHFEDEEHVLAKLRYPGFAHHASLHAVLGARALELAQAFRSGHLSVGDLLQYLANDVVAAHMLKADREFFHLTAT